MKKIVALSVVFVLFVGFVAWASGSGEEDVPEGTYLFKYAHEQPDGHPRSKNMFWFRDELEKRTDGRIRVRVYTSASLGSEREIYDLVATGSLQGTRSGYFINANPKYNIFMLPFMFDNYAQLVKFSKSDFVKKIGEGAKKNGIYIPATAVLGGRDILNNARPLKTPADFKGLKIRVPGQDGIIKTFEALGANIQRMPMSEAYLALSTGVVNAADSDPANLYTGQKIHEVTDYYTVIEYVSSGPDPLMVNLKWYESLPSDLQKIFNEVSEEAMSKYNVLHEKKNLEDREAIKKNVKRTDVISAAEKKNFKKIAKPVVYKFMVDKGYFTWDDITEVEKIIAK